MLTFLFIILMIAFVGKLIIWAIKAAWGITKVVLTIVLFPIILIVLACVGFIYIALALLLVGGVIAIVKSVKNR